MFVCVATLCVCLYVCMSVKYFCEFMCVYVYLCAYDIMFLCISICHLSVCSSLHSSILYFAASLYYCVCVYVSVFACAYRR